jgi:hypothetical protein
VVRPALREKDNRPAVVIAILEKWAVICWVVVAAGAMIMVGVMLYSDGSAVQLTLPPLPPPAAPIGPSCADFCACATNG